MLRKLDSFGKIVLPKEMRKNFEIEAETPLEIYTEDDSIVLKKYQNKCIFCGGTDELISFKGKYICSKCKADITK